MYSLLASEAPVRLSHLTRRLLWANMASFEICLDALHATYFNQAGNAERLAAGLAFKAVSKEAGKLCFHAGSMDLLIIHTYYQASCCAP
eukprot:scaffold455485_cov19-Prasinocladus_malaysianus.AAC.1